MIKGLGIDIVEIERIRSIQDHEKFIKRILSDKELKIYETFTHIDRKIQFLAGRFAAKEAYSKALGTGIGELKFKDIVVLNDEKGKPFIEVDQYNVHLSISHSDHYAVANVVIT